MIIYKCLISGDEFISDAYPSQLLHNDTILEVPARYRAKGDNFKMADDSDGEDENAEMVIDLVDGFHLVETQLDKKTFMAWVKNFLKAVVAKLKEIGKEDRVAAFQKGATEFVKFVIPRIDEFQFYAGENIDLAGHLALSYQKNQEDAGPTFLYFIDSFAEIKL